MDECHFDLRDCDNPFAAEESETRDYAVKMPWFATAQRPHPPLRRPARLRRASSPSEAHSPRGCRKQVAAALSCLSKIAPSSPPFFEPCRWDCGLRGASGGGGCVASMSNLTYLQAAGVYAQQLGTIHPLTIAAITLGSLLCACGLCLGVLVMGRRLSRAERAISEYKVERSALMMTRDPGVDESDGLGAELTEPARPTSAGRAFPLELSVVAITKAIEL